LGGDISIHGWIVAANSLRRKIKKRSKIFGGGFPNKLSYPSI